MTESGEKMERIFKDLDRLLKSGSFRDLEVDFMAQALEMFLNAVKKLQVRIAEKKAQDKNPPPPPEGE